MTDIASQPASTGDGTAAHITDQTKAVGGSAVSAGSDVVQSAKEQGREVAAEAGRQAKDMYGRARTEMTDQARTQQKRAVSGLYAVADEAARIADRGGESGPVTQVVRDASSRITQAGRWLEDREPGQLLDEVKRYARRHPGAFLLAAAALGVAAGRFAKNLAGGSDDDASTQPREGYADVSAATAPSTAESPARYTGNEAASGTLLDDAAPVRRFAPADDPAERLRS